MLAHRMVAVVRHGVRRRRVGGIVALVVSGVAGSEVRVAASAQVVVEVGVGDGGVELRLHYRIESSGVVVIHSADVSAGLQFKGSRQTDRQVDAS